jgi:hypothetical protein
MKDERKGTDRVTREETVVNPCASGDPPPQGSLSRRFLAIANDRDGGSSTSAESPRNGMIETCHSI